jgi:predicted HTH transcriptional regulator
MAMKHWIASEVDTLKASLGPIAYESNELDWKQSLSPKKDRLARHLSAFANHPNGGVMVFGVDEKTALPLGIEQAEAEA